MDRSSRYYVFYKAGIGFLATVLLAVTAALAIHLTTRVNQDASLVKYSNIALIKSGERRRIGLSNDVNDINLELTDHRHGSAHNVTGFEKLVADQLQLAEPPQAGDLERPETRGRDDEMDISEIYTNWSRWSRCSRRCKQKRERQCSKPAICGNAVVRMERGCHSDRCRGRDFHIVRKKKMRRKTKNQLKRNRAFYTRWSRWTQCTDICKTTRVKSCRFPLVCGNNKVTEEAYCYTEGSQCEAWYKAGKSLDITDEEGFFIGDNSHDGTDGDEGGGDQDLTGNGDDQESDKASANGEKTEVNRVKDYAGRCGLRKNRAHHPFIQQQQQHKQPHWTKKDGDVKTEAPHASVDLAWALRIIGGREAEHGRWPWQVVILNKYREAFCGGTLVHPRWVLTASHCVRKHLLVRVGEHDLVVHEGSEKEYVVARTIIHPGYNRDTVDNDVALLELPEMVKLGRYTSLACLPRQNEPLPMGEHCTIIGWGKEKKSHFFGTEVLHEARVPIVSMSDCMTVYKNYYITDNMFCAGYKGGRIDSCAGDSGGPLLCQKGDQWTIYGITSFGEGCGRQGKYGIYAKVPNYSDWIERTIEREEDERRLQQSSPRPL